MYPWPFKYNFTLTLINSLQYILYIHTMEFDQLWHSIQILDAYECIVVEYNQEAFPFQEAKSSEVEQRSYSATMHKQNVFNICFI